MLQDLLPAFVALFVVIDPIGMAPIFIAVTQGASAAQRRRIAIRAILVSAAILALFGLAGEGILAALGVGMPAFRISGGLMLFLIAVEMLFEKRTERRSRSAEQSQREEQERHPEPGLQSDPSVFPLATPLIAGPGSMATLVLLMGEHEGDVAGQAALFGVLALVLAICLALFLVAGLVERLLGKTAINVITRLFGVLLGALSVQFVLDGLAAYGAFGAGS